MTMSREECGRIGGLRTLERHGRNHFSSIGKSPKPRNPTLAEILERNPELTIKEDWKEKNPRQLSLAAQRVIDRIIREAREVHLIESKKSL